MSNVYGLNRRSFLKSAGMTALAGAVGTGSTVAAAAEASVSPIGGKFNFDEVYGRFGTDCYRWDDQITRFGEGSIKAGMGIADMDFRAAPCITEALAERCKHENWGYMVPRKTYYEAIAKWNRERHDTDIGTDSIVLTSGVHPALVSALQTFAPPGSKVLLTTPVYSGFYDDLIWTRTLANESPMIVKNGRYEIDWDDLEARITPDTQAFILCNPQNPTGNLWSQDDLLRLGRLCLENNIVVLADEIHCDFVMKGQKYVPFATLPDKDVVNNSVTFKAISKTFSLAAMKNAYFFSTNPVYLERVKANHQAFLNSLGLVANEAAYRHGGDWVDQLMPYIDANHDFVESYIKKNMPLVDYTKAQGTYLAWLDVSKVIDAIGAREMAAASEKTDTPMTTEEFVEKWFVENSGVQLNAGTKYGTGGEGHMRMNLGSPRSVIKQALDSMSTAMEKV